MLKLALILTSSIILFACTPLPENIEFGKDQCEHCQMTITENRWGGEIVTKKSKVYFFDSIECLISYLNLNQNDINSKVFSTWTVNYLNPGELIECKSAYYLHSTQLHSPMGLNVASFKNEIDLKQFENYENAKKVKYPDVCDLVKIGW